MACLVYQINVCADILETSAEIRKLSSQIKMSKE